IGQRGRRPAGCWSNSRQHRKIAPRCVPPFRTCRIAPRSEWRDYADSIRTRRSNVEVAAATNDSGDPSRADATARAHDEALWRNLFLLVEAGEVVPIVGRELLQVGTPPTHLYATL